MLFVHPPVLFLKSILRLTVTSVSPNVAAPDPVGFRRIELPHHQIWGYWQGMPAIGRHDKSAFDLRTYPLGPHQQPNPLLSNLQPTSTKLLMDSRLAVLASNLAVYGTHMSEQYLLAQTRVS